MKGHSGEAMGHRHREIGSK